MKSPNLSSITACSISALATAQAFAHEGHGDHDASVFSAISHWFTHWDHLALVVAGVAVVAWLGRKALRALGKERTR